MVYFPCPKTLSLKRECKTFKEMTFYQKAWSFMTCHLTLTMGLIYQIGVKAFQGSTRAMVCLYYWFIQVLDSPLREWFIWKQVEQYLHSAPNTQPIWEASRELLPTYTVCSNHVNKASGSHF